ncbi:MAG: tautomerase family protein [Actinomycetes bacterium]|jgi:4-oxalocrotonate tautomerase
MPLVRVDLHEGRAEEELAAIGDAVHEAMVETIGVPADDRFQVITEHRPGWLRYDRHYLGVDRDDGIVLVQITLARGRPVEKKEALYRRIAEGLSERAGVASRNVFVSLVEVGREDWSFGEGVAQYAVADRDAAGS